MNEQCDDTSAVWPMKTISTPNRNVEATTDKRLTGQAAQKPVHLRLYIAGSTPNSIRAEQNLKIALKTFSDEEFAFNIEVIDVFTSSKRAILDNVIVTPTLLVIAAGQSQTVVGDLSQTSKLQAILRG